MALDLRDERVIVVNRFFELPKEVLSKAEVRVFAYSNKVSKDDIWRALYLIAAEKLNEARDIIGGDILIGPIKESAGFCIGCIIDLSEPMLEPIKPRF